MTDKTIAWILFGMFMINLIFILGATFLAAYNGAFLVVAMLSLISILPLMMVILTFTEAISYE